MASSATNITTGGVSHSLQATTTTNAIGFVKAHLLGLPPSNLGKKMSVGFFENLPYTKKYHHFQNSCNFLN